MQQQNLLPLNVKSKVSKKQFIDDLDPIKAHEIGRGGKEIQPPDLFYTGFSNFIRCLLTLNKLGINIEMKIYLKNDSGFCGCS